MEFEERVREVISGAVQAVETERDLDEEFRSVWELARERFREVARRIGKSIEGMAGVATFVRYADSPNNRIELHLAFGRNEEIEYSLGFSAEPGSRLVAVASNRDLVKIDPLPPADLTKEKIEGIFLAFFDAIGDALVADRHQLE